MGAAVAVTAAEIPAAEAAAGGEVPAAPVLLVATGRGRVGKSTLLAWAIGRALAAGREVVAADGDARNPTLSRRYRAAAVAPRSGEPADVRDWLTEEVLNGMAADRRSVGLDLGGGDRVLLEFGRDIDLVEFCGEIGVVPVGVHVVGPDLDDLRHVAAIEAAGHFLAPRTLVVTNEALVRQGQTAATAFLPLTETPEWRALMARGARPVLMPRLPCMAELDRLGLGPVEAAAGLGVVGPVQRAMARKWCRDLEAAFGAAAAWLP